MTAKEQFVACLNSAYAMEVSLAKVLENHAKNAKKYPEIQRQIEQHLEATRRHAKRVEDCLQLLGEASTTLIFGNITGLLQGTTTGIFKDELANNFLSDYSAEHFEIACYRSLIAAAEDLGLPEITVICEEILMEEEAMADWIQDRIPEITRNVLHQQTNAVR